MQVTWRKNNEHALLLTTELFRKACCWSTWDETVENQERKTSLKKSKNKLTFTFHNSFDRGCLTICGQGPFCVSTKTNLSSICVLHRFSRRVLWLRVAYTNNDPQVVASYFMNFVTEVGGKTIVFSNVTLSQLWL